MISNTNLFDKGQASLPALIHYPVSCSSTAHNSHYVSGWRHLQVRYALQATQLLVIFGELMDLLLVSQDIRVCVSIMDEL